MDALCGSPHSSLSWEKRRMDQSKSPEAEDRQCIKKPLVSGEKAKAMYSKLATETFSLTHSWLRGLVGLV
jgi:hypothetical protein